MAKADKRAVVEDPGLGDPVPPDPADAIASDIAELNDAQPDTMPDPLPMQVRLASMYGYWGDDGLLRMWAQGQVITDPMELGDLIQRGAPLEEVP